jgi:NTP pyrophosphatase (non-canonical NTP hydrolase)
MNHDINELVRNVLQWGEDKGITGPNGKGTLLAQLSKTQEELTETRDAAVRLESASHYLHELVDGIGDCAVTLILAAELGGVPFESCLATAYNEIKGRTGKMENGQFLKD